MTRRNTLFAVICVVALLSFWMPLTTLYGLSGQPDQEMYSHTLLILPMSLGLVYLRRRQIFFGVRYCFRLGMVALFGGVMLYWLAHRHSHDLSQNHYLSLAVFAFVLVLIGGFVVCYGGQAFRTAAFPLLFLLLMMPVPEFLLERIVFALLRGSAEVADAFFKLSGVPVFRQGFTFFLPNITIDITQECSGIRSTLALFITSLVAGYVFLQSKWRRAFLSMFVIAVGIIKNGVRIVTLSLLAAYVDKGFLTGSLHHRYGGTVFSLLALAVLGPVLWLLQRQERGVEYPARFADHSNYIPPLRRPAGG
jgi:exosortase